MIRLFSEKTLHNFVNLHLNRGFQCYAEFSSVAYCLEVCYFQ